MGSSEQSAPGRLARARAALDNDDALHARALCHELLAEDPADPAALSLLGQSELRLNRDADALGHFAAAVALAPRDVSRLKDLALAQSQTGDLAAGEGTLRRALQIAPDYVAGHYFLSLIKRYRADDPDLAALERLAAREGELEPGERVQLGFALGKALDDIGDHERSFAQLRAANAVKRAAMSYDLAGDLAFLRRVAHTFDGELLARQAGRGHATRLPVLIVGMPRSGTTLVEQILASHPAVSAGGERSDLAHVSASVALLGDSRAPFPEGVRDLPGELLSQLGAGYARRLERLAPGAARVTDKNLFNFAYLGMAALVVPGAHVIHCTREPLDACVSCFALDFAEVRFSFDLAELGAFYRGYRRLMDHWRAVLPPGWLHEVRYEDLVADPERVIRALVAHCGLEWHPRCLRFQEARRSVRTASFAQVRRPISERSVGRWRRYEPWLGPLVAALEGEPPGGGPPDGESPGGERPGSGPPRGA